MLVRLMIETEIDPATDVPRLQEYLGAHRHMMLDPGGDEKSFIGQFAGCVSVYGEEPVPISQEPLLNGKA